MSYKNIGILFFIFAFMFTFTGHISVVTAAVDIEEGDSETVDENTDEEEIDLPGETAPVEEPVVEEEESTQNRSGSRRSSGGGSGSVLGASTDSEGMVLGATTDASTSSAKFNVNLGVGSRGADVMRLQEVLAALGFFKVTPTGYFGPITLQAVKDYQTAKGIAFVTGFVGPLTRAELNK